MEKSDITVRKQCRLCDATAFKKVLSLTPTPPANGLIYENNKIIKERCYLLDVYRCDDCGHIQLLNIVDPNLLFKNYPYVSSTSPVMVKHLTAYAHSVIETLQIKPGSFVVELGSNDGTLLSIFKAEGMRVLGVDPAENIATIAQESGITTLNKFFDKKVADEIEETYGKATLICANHVCAHIDDLSGFIDGVKSLLSPSGVFVFEVGYLVDVYQKTLFDTIYHEHVDFHRVGPLARFFSKKGMTLVHAERVEIQGGALRGYVRLGQHPQHDSIENLICLEESLGLHKAETFERYAIQIGYRRNELMALLKGLKQNGQTIVGYGSPAKAVTLMYHFGLDKSIMDYIVEDNPLKQGSYTPGFRVPIVSVDAIYEHKPDYILVLAWNFAHDIIARHRHYAGSKSRFIVPLPNMQVVGDYA